MPFTSDALSSGTYNLTVASEDDWREETGEVTGSVPPEFTSLDLRLTKVTGAGDVQRAEFDYNIQYGNPSTTIEFLLNKSGSTVDAATRTGTGEIWEWDHSKQAKPITYRINITSGGGECYEIDVPTSASEGDTYDVTSAGTSC